VGVSLAALAALARRLAATRGRNDKIRLAAELLRAVPAAEVPWAVAFLGARPFPASDPRVLDVGGALLAEVRGALGPPPAEPALAIGDVARAFEAVAAARGAGSRRLRTELLRDLLARATADERELLVKLVYGEMRMGLHEGLLPDVIAAASGAEVAQVRRALQLVSDPSEVARVALVEGPPALAAIGLRLFVPLLPMLAEPVADAEALLETHGGRTALEWKYDGARIQLHKDGEAVRIWSRRLTEVTASLPDVVALARAELVGTRCIVDGEVVALGAAGRPLPFQDLMRRFRRVHGIEASAGELPLALLLFDCLLLDDRELLDATYEERWAALERLTGGRHVARRSVASSAAEVDAFLAEALAAGHEGLVAKALDSPYTPGTRGSRWLKLKVAETLDCVILAADRGSGRRQGWLSNYHLAVAGGATGFAPVGKTFKGFTDQEFAEMTARLRALATGDDGYTVTVRPEVVVEVAYNEIQRSPQYASGFALRFARIARVRDDKSPAHASTLDELRARFQAQFAAKARRGGEGAAEPDGAP